MGLMNHAGLQLMLFVVAFHSEMHPCPLRGLKPVDIRPNPTDNPHLQCLAAPGDEPCFGCLMSAAATHLVRVLI
jgi:hypothetical protein